MEGKMLSGSIFGTFLCALVAGAIADIKNRV
jgi:hypothetical protein